MKKILILIWSVLSLLFINTITLASLAGTVDEAQRILNLLGYNADPEDGIYGGKTKRALENFYLEKNERFDGTLDSIEIKDLKFVLNQSQKSLPIFKNINHSTERFRRSQIMCKIAAEENFKPFPKGKDDFRSSADMSTYADLYGDGSFEFITGVSDSTYLRKKQEFPYEGNEKRAKEPSDYRIYSPQADFKLDLSLLFHNAHLITPELISLNQ